MTQDDPRHAKSMNAVVGIDLGSLLVGVECYTLPCSLNPQRGGVVGIQRYYITPCSLNPPRAGPYVSCHVSVIQRHFTSHAVITDQGDQRITTEKGKSQVERITTSLLFEPTIGLHPQQVTLVVQVVRYYM